MSKYLFVLVALLSVAIATPIIVSECGRLDSSSSTYKLMSDIVVRDNTEVCFDITGKGITLDGNGFELSSASGNMLPGTGVQYSGESVTVMNLHIRNIRTGIHAKGKFGYVYNNVITQGTNGIDVSATNNRISHNTIGDFSTTDESTSGIYVYFPAIVPVDSYVNISNNVISNIRGSFAQGISLYYANSVDISHNRIYDIVGELMSQDISSIESNSATFDNVFAPAPALGMSYTSMIITAVILLASAIFFRASSPFRVSSVKDEIKHEVKDYIAGLPAMKKDEKDEFEADGADVVPKKIQRFSLSSSLSLLSSPIM